MSTTQNETVGIAQTVERSLRDAGYGSYNSYAAPVVEALTARENDLAEKLIDYAVDAGADADLVKAYMREIGLIVPATEEDGDPMVMDDDPEDSDTGALGRIEQALTNLTGRIDNLTQFARSNGYRGN